MNPNENEPTPPLTDEEREHRRVRYAQYWASKRVAEEAAALAAPTLPHRSRQMRLSCM